MRNAERPGKLFGPLLSKLILVPRSETNLTYLALQVALRIIKFSYTKAYICLCACINIRVVVIITTTRAH